MEDKTFELLSKMYSEFSKRFDDVNHEIKGLKNEVQENSSRLKNIELVIENNMKPDIKAIYQLQTDVATKLDSHDLKLKNIEEKLETLSAKSSRHSYEIGAIKRQKKVK